MQYWLTAPALRASYLKHAARKKDSNVTGTPIEEYIEHIKTIVSLYLRTNELPAEELTDFTKDLEGYVSEPTIRYLMDLNRIQALVNAFSDQSALPGFDKDLPSCKGAINPLNTFMQLSKDSEKMAEVNKYESFCNAVRVGKY